jgi:hypothetical protein
MNLVLNPNLMTICRPQLLQDYRHLTKVVESPSPMSLGLRLHRLINIRKHCQWLQCHESRPSDLPLSTPVSRVQRRSERGLPVIYCAGVRTAPRQKRSACISGRLNTLPLQARSLSKQSRDDQKRGRTHLIRNHRSLVTKQIFNRE